VLRKIINPTGDHTEISNGNLLLKPKDIERSLKKYIQTPRIVPKNKYIKVLYCLLLPIVNVVDTRIIANKKKGNVKYL
tara:strand:+ start:500 stop:733 length:234 start_codon:yes stop_codon:yes gene_type:complete